MNPKIKNFMLLAFTLKFDFISAMKFLVHKGLPVRLAKFEKAKLCNSVSIKTWARMGRGFWTHSYVVPEDRAPINGGNIGAAPVPFSPTSVLAAPLMINEVTA